MKRWLAGTAGLMIATGLCAQEKTEAIDTFAHRIALQTTGSDGMYRFTLPTAVYQGVAHADLRDLRVFNAAGERVPMAFAADARRDAEKRVVVSLPLFPLRESGTTIAAGGLDLQIRQQTDGTLVSLRSGPQTKAAAGKLTGYLLDASKLDKPIHALEFDWKPGVDAQSGRVTIEAGDDLKSWRTIANAAPLVDLEFGGQRLEQKRVEFASSTSKYLRLTWSKSAFDLNKVEAESIEAQSKRVLQTLTVEGKPGEKAGEYVFDLGAKLPVERVRLLLPEANTVAPAQLLVRGDSNAAWRPVVGATFYRLTRDGAELVSPPTVAGSYGERYWLTRIDSRSGGIGGAMPKLEVSWRPREIIFVARGAGPYQLAFGRREAANAGFAVSALMPGYQAEAEYTLPQATAAADAVNVAPMPTEEAGSLLSAVTKKQVVLWAVLLLGVGLLGWMAWKLSRDMKKTD